MKYRKVLDGGEVEFKRNSTQNIACCDCGLVHEVKVIRGQALTTWTRNNRSTAAKRRKKQRITCK